ncbi:MAG: hypothetical protein H6581_27085 [Bacteroidia bacterium]|nr:hypothetical protein [Bacteroidia bacterium]
MKYLEFENAFRDFPVISLSDMQKRFPGFDSRRLVEWQEKGYLQKVKRGFYSFSEGTRNESLLCFIANKIYVPSYISLESALSYYGLIPEGVFSITSVTTRNTANCNSEVGDFSFRHIKPELFFGYKLVHEKGFSFKIAEPEKLILDFFYLNQLNSEEAIEGVRINEFQARELISFSRLEEYQRMFSSHVLDHRIDLFKKVIHA